MLLIPSLQSNLYVITFVPKSLMPSLIVSLVSCKCKSWGWRGPAWGAGAGGGTGDTGHRGDLVLLLPMYHRVLMVFTEYF